MTEPERETPPPEPGPANEHHIPGDVLQKCLDEAAADTFTVNVGNGIAAAVGQAQK